eukprot:TRINITY_DN12459_c0_g1_i1.p2 TRINITY_DN12459_c0_g1~~TRINITY_DN12459_c0_g1_i1.p2  ORF type:complete len:165 (-),score=11.35 TRINITY_DN12459_c0_g1_i1:62-556(-)
MGHHFTTREVALVNTCWQWACSTHLPPYGTMTKDELEQLLVVDRSQCIERRPWSLGLKTMMTTSKPFLFSRKGEAVPAEHFLALGFPKHLDFCSRLGHTKLRELAGDCMSMPCVTQIILVFLFWALFEKNEGGPRARDGMLSECLGATGEAPHKHTQVGGGALG